jgi:hypothetical protein
MKGDFDFFTMVGSGGFSESLATTCEEKKLGHRI